jgi:hypothetical protein
VKRVYAGVLRHFYLQPIHQILWIKSDGTRDAQRRQMPVGSHVVNVLWGHAGKTCCFARALLVFAFPRISTIRIRPTHKASRTNQVVDVTPICSSHDTSGSRGWLALPKLSFITRGIETGHTVFTRAGISPRANHRGKPRATRSDRSSQSPSPAVSALRLSPSDFGEGTQSQLTERTKNESR